MAPAFVSVREAAVQMGICRELVRREIRAGRLAAITHGTKLLVSTESLDEWIALKTDEARREQARTSGLDYLRRSAASLPRVKGGNRGIAAGMAAVALFKGTNDTKKPASQN